MILIIYFICLKILILIKKIKTEKIKDTLKFISDYDLATVDGDSHMTKFMYKKQIKNFYKKFK